jgi:hypothetical protein
LKINLKYYVIFSDCKGLFGKPYFYFHYANKPLLAIYKVLFENLIYYENYIPYCSKMFCSILGKFTIWFESFWSQNEKDIKEIRK